MSRDFIRCASALKRVLSEDRVNTIASKATFFERLRKLTPIRTIWTFVTAMGSGTTNSLAGILRLFTDLTAVGFEIAIFVVPLQHPLMFRFRTAKNDVVFVIQDDNIVVAEERVE